MHYHNEFVAAQYQSIFQTRLLQDHPSTPGDSNGEEGTKNDKEDEIPGWVSSKVRNKQLHVTDKRSKGSPKETLVVLPKARRSQRRNAATVQTESA